MASWHWLKHAWTVWSERQQDKGTLIDSSPYQTRECMVCGLIQRRWM